MKRISVLLAITLFLKVSNAQIPNPDFEQWTNLLPDEWITNSCPFCDPPWESYIVRQDSDAYSGNFNVDFYGNGVFKPYAYSRFPVNYRPVKLKFFAKISFPACINDSGWPGDTVAASIKLLHNGAIVDSGYWSYSGININNYQLIEVPLSGNAAAFDSCMVYFEGGNIFGGCGVIAAATRFKVDALELLADSFICSSLFYYSKRIDTVDFQGSTNLDSVTTWQWEFGDAQSGNTQIVNHIYSQDSWYYPCLTVTGIDSSGFGCTTTYCDSILITHDCIDTSQICPPPSLCCDAPLFEPVCGCDSVTYDNACQATAWYGITKYTEGPCVTSVKETLADAKVSLIPNPANEKTIMTIDLKQLGNVIVRIKNILGETIAQHNAEVRSPHYSTEIQLNDLSRGIYFVEILLNEKIASVKKLIKE